MSEPPSDPAPDAGERAPASRPTFPAISPPLLTIEVPFSADAQRALILASMSCSPDQWQISLSPLDQYSQLELLEKWEAILRDPPEMPCFRPEEVKSCLSFERDEDFILLLFLRSGGALDFQDFLEIWGFVFKPFRSVQNLRERATFLNLLSPQEIEEFYDSYAQTVLSEELADCAMSESKVFSRSICSFSPEFPIEPIATIDSQIDQIMPRLTGLAFSNDSLRGILAILRSERNQYLMRREALLIGRGVPEHPVDIDLTFESDRTCAHISRLQAVLAFLEDGCFYIENIGHQGFRVNGVAIATGQMCKLPGGALLDFSGTLLMFIPNETLVAEIRVAVGGGNGSTRNRS